MSRPEGDQWTDTERWAAIRLDFEEFAPRLEGSMYRRELDNRIRALGFSLLTEVDALAARVRELESLLRRVTLKEMGGCPDLYAPRGGWDQFEVDVDAALGPTRRDAP